MLEGLAGDRHPERVRVREVELRLPTPSDGLLSIASRLGGGNRCSLADLVEEFDQWVLLAARMAVPVRRSIAHESQQLFGKGAGNFPRASQVLILLLPDPADGRRHSKRPPDRR